jgi:hypothetical protein
MTGDQSVDQLAPLSIGQERYLELHYANPQSYADHMPYLFRVHGELNLSALEDSLAEIQRRYTILRTIYTLDPPYSQVVLPTTGFAFSVVDLDQKQASMAWQEYVETERKRPFDLTKETSLRCAVFKLAEQSYVLVLTIHHIAFDFHSEIIFFRELETLYTSFSTGVTPQLKEVPVQYKDFAVRQREQQNSEVWSRHIQWWLSHLAGDPPILTLPADIPSPVSTGIAGSYIEQVLHPKLVNDLHAFSKQNGVSLFVLLFASFNLFIHEITKETNIVIGVPISIRSSSDLGRAIGVFAHSVALRTDLSQVSTFGQLLKMTNATVFSALKHRDVPIYTVAEQMPTRSFSQGNPFYKLRFNFFNTFYDGLQLPGVEIDEIRVTGATNPDLQVSVQHAGTKGIQINWMYDAGLYTQECIEQWADQFQSLLESVLVQPERQLESGVTFCLD